LDEPVGASVFLKCRDRANRDKTHSNGGISGNKNDICPNEDRGFFNSGKMTVSGWNRKIRHSKYLQSLRTCTFKT